MQTLRITYIIGLFVISVLSIQAQNITADSTNNDTATDYLNNYFIFDVSYTNNNSASQNTQTEQTAATITDLSFYHKSGLWASVMPVVYHNTKITSYDMNAILGYQTFFDNGFDFNTSYNYHNYTGDSAFMGIEYNHSLDLSIGYLYNGLYTYIDNYSLWGKSANYFSNIGFGYYEELSISKNSYISIFPMVSLTFGTDYWVYDDLTQIEYTRSKYLLYNNGYSWNTFDLQSFDFILPISFNYNNFSGSVSYIHSIPTNKYKLLEWENQSGLMISLSFLLDLK